MTIKKKQNTNVAAKKNVYLHTITRESFRFFFDVVDSDFDFRFKQV